MQTAIRPRGLTPVLHYPQSELREVQSELREVPAVDPPDSLWRDSAGGQAPPPPSQGWFGQVAKNVFRVLKGLARRRRFIASAPAGQVSTLSKKAIQALKIDTRAVKQAFAPELPAGASRLGVDQRGRVFLVARKRGARPPIATGYELRELQRWFPDRR